MKRPAMLGVIVVVAVGAFGAFALAQDRVRISPERLFTPPLSGDTFFCSVANVSNGPVIVNVSIVDFTGQVMAEESDSCPTGVLQPRHSCAVFVTPANTLAHCRISLLGNKDQVRGALSVYKDRADVLTGAVAAVDAR